MTHIFKKTISISLAFVLYCSTVQPTIAQPVPVLALPLVSNPVGLIFIGTVAVGGVIWYIYQDRHHKKFRSRVRYGTVHSRSHEQHEEKLFPDMGNKTCQQLADEETVKTGKKWYVKNWGPVPYTGPLWNPGQKVKFECTITTDPNAVKKGD